MQRKCWGFGILVALTLMGCNATQPAEVKTPTVGEAFQQEVAVVDAEKLLQLHPDYENLRRLEQEIRDLEVRQEEIPKEAFAKVRDKGQSTMEKAYNQAKAEMEAEQAAISGEMDGLARALQLQMSSELNEIKAKLDRDLQESIRKVQGSQDPLKQTDVGNNDMGEYGENLKLVAGRTLAARRLELEKASQGELTAERNRLDQELASFEDQIGARYQEEKLNLQLKMQNNPGEEVEKATRERLNAIDDEISAAKATKRQEVDAAMEAFRQKKQSAFDSEIAALEASIRQEMAAKVAQKQGQPIPRPGAAPVPEEVKAKIAAAQSRMESEMASRKAELQARMSQKENEARARLKEKADQIQKRLTELNTQLQKQFAGRTDFLDKATKAKLEQVKQDLEKARADRKQVFDKMLADLDKAVGKVAEKKNIPCVVGQFVVNNDLTDLTDLSMVEVKQIGSP